MEKEVFDNEIKLEKKGLSKFSMMAYGLGDFSESIRLDICRHLFNGFLYRYCRSSTDSSFHDYAGGAFVGWD